ncbi:actin-like protein arp-6 [Gaeumannomyces tritici R3-111a-1]|uniref:Actin-like protein ARP6 n=1 Tax=Gaeumannomyces tritici (strain R3-111a-1) TaxID=644352 RepID=J3P4V9_GAET3|nr:actin-like protein arp-6 [Gaeumannomyces tritici R3-111a-1]EJT74707.1 actin-like protein arp-6 [Gaeumannomyces tritici R3-111a-1]
MAGGRKSRAAAAAAPPRQTLVLDNGAYTLKAGLVARSDDDNDGDDSGATKKTPEEPRVIPNCIARDRHRRTYVGSELSRCRDFGEMAFRRPVERGYVVNWETQREIWDRELLDPKTSPRPCDPAEARLVLAEQPGALPALQANCDQMVFEEFGFASYYRGIGPAFNAYHDIQSIFRTPREANAVARLPAEAILLVDAGHSCTTVTPLLRGRPLHPAVRRLNVGGKFMTNYLTRLLSLRHYDMRADPHIVNELKEKACYVSLDFRADLERCWKGTRGEVRDDYLTGGGVARDYVLPDFDARFEGVVREYDPLRAARSAKKAARGGGADPSAATVAAAAAAAADEDVLTLRNERFSVPELLFNPSDAGGSSSRRPPRPGVADLVMQSLAAVPTGLWPALLANVVVVGGSALLDGFVQRLQQEVVQRVPDECIVRVARPADPVASTWHGAAAFAAHPHADRLAVTRQEYEEHGALWVARRFAAGLGLDD